MIKPTLTQARLKQLVEYDPDTGIFFRFVCQREAHAADTNGYIRFRIDCNRYLAHRLAFLYMDGAFPPDCVDHINRIRHDNRWCNLRHATYSQNALNRGAKGITWTTKVDPEYGSVHHYWVARIMIKGKRHALGSFNNYDDALAARKAGELKYGPT